MSQLALPLKLQDHAVFASFWAAGNDALVAYLRDLGAAGAGPGCWIWGAKSCGKTHLLQALCVDAGDTAQYVPLAEFAAADPGILDGLASRRIICLDDIDAVAGNEQWELALFDLYNQVTDSGGVIVVAASAAQRESGVRLPDLDSRFSRLPTFRVHELDDEGRIKALQLRAKHRGLDLPDDTAKFLLNRSRRDMASLYRMLDKLDGEALAAKRRLTVPFVRDVLS